MKKEIKQLRLTIDGLAQSAKDSNINIDSKQMDKAIDSLYLAKAWLGKLLGELGEESPYKNDGKRNSIEDIEPTSDKFEGNVNFDTIPNTTAPWFDVFNKDKNHIQKVDWLRTEIQKILSNKILFDVQEIENPSFIIRISEFYYMHLCEAKFWLGFELERIKTEKK